MPLLPGRLGTKDTGLEGGSEGSGFSKRALGLQARHSTGYSQARALRLPLLPQQAWWMVLALGRCYSRSLLPIMQLMNGAPLLQSCSNNPPAGSVHEFWQCLSVGTWKTRCSTA